MKNNALKKSVAVTPVKSHADEERDDWLASATGLSLCAIAFLVCIVMSITPLNRLQSLADIRDWPTSALLLSPGSWLPIDLKLVSRLRDSQVSTHLIWLLSLVALEFIIYALATYWIQRQSRDYNSRHTLGIIWFVVLLAGLIYVCTPALLSRDVFVYAGYGRVLAGYHANPYFVTLSAYPQDALIPLDDWKAALCAYGPVWLLLCGLSSLLAGEHTVVYVFFFRILGFAAHALNILLVVAILRTMGQNSRTVAQGALLYAWNPLVLQESCLGGHNDTFMVTFLLLGLLYSARAEQHKHLFTAPRSYLPPLIAFTLAALIKFTSVPLIVLFLALLLWKALQSDNQLPGRFSLRALQPLTWHRLPLTMLTACMVSIGIVLAFYAPFWVGHSLYDILVSFSSPPSARSAYGSILGALLNWERAYAGMNRGWASPLISLLSQHTTWQNISAGVAALALLLSLIWLWRIPTTRTLALAALAVLGALLVVTPWFFPWYVIWLVGLSAICLPVMHERMGRALLGFALTFSASAHFIYFFRGYQPIGDWMGWTFLTTIGPPLLVLCLLLTIPRLSTR
ncbi:MAG: hypothetical protein NVS4B9_05220 [Ktedonobacteraceae bacterium]